MKEIKRYEKTGEKKKGEGKGKVETLGGYLKMNWGNLSMQAYFPCCLRKVIGWHEVPGLVT